ARHVLHPQRPDQRRPAGLLPAAPASRSLVTNTQRTAEARTTKTPTCLRGTRVLASTLHPSASSARQAPPSASKTRPRPPTRVSAPPRLGVKLQFPRPTNAERGVVLPRGELVPHSPASSARIAAPPPHSTPPLLLCAKPGNGSATPASAVGLPNSASAVNSS